MRFVLVLVACLIGTAAFGQADAAKERCNQGVEFYNQGELDKAIVEFTAAIALSPNNAFAFKCRSFVLTARGDHDRALADLNEAIALEPKDGDAHFSRGNLWRLKGELEKALADYDKAIAIDPGSASAYVNRGTLLVEQGDNERALADYNEAILIAPELAAAYSGRAWILATSPIGAFRDGPKAIEDAKRANQLSHWKQADQLDTLAAAYAEVGKFDEAVKYQEQAIRLSTDEKLTKEFRSRLSLYRAEKPFRSEAPKQKT
ncbi:TPR domain protein [Rhodopirellula islandica]|uniref:TPR domain protein n=1 Tax=Rhodopirellula islandica TaxID=595434 RepID=A0A0J1B5K5_RHOIS|nr:tetratricopeptide repeat protein [Rhodopirellula islandica]KLU02012.1 TPR domain protein [Rhodopirellula islandica]